jgi:hypothetical protein
LLSDDQETIVRTIERVRSILDAHVEGRGDAAWVVERLQSTLTRAEVERALYRLDRRRLLRLID